jgi:hypothetical protein
VPHFIKLAFKICIPLGAVLRDSAKPAVSVSACFSSWVFLIFLQQENKGLREILQITRESFLNLRKDDASESTSLSALVTNSDLSLRKSWVAFCAVTRMGPEVSGWVNIKPNFSQPFPSGMYRDTGKETAAECITSGHKLDPSHSQKGDAEPQSEQRVFKVLLSTAVSEVLLAS